MKFYRLLFNISLLFWVNGNEEFVYVFMQCALCTTHTYIQKYIHIINDQSKSLINIININLLNNVEKNGTKILYLKSGPLFIL